MIIKANSLEEASQIAIDSFGSKKDFEIYTISPAKKLLGFIKLKGTYKVVLKKIINEKQNYIKDGYIEISSGKLTVKNPVNCSNYAKIIANNPNVNIYKNSIKKYALQRA